MTKTKREQISDGQAAERLLRDDSLLKLFSEVEADVYRRFSAAKDGDTDTLSALKSELSGVNALRRRLRVWIDDATIAKKSAE